MSTGTPVTFVDNATDDSFSGRHVIRLFPRNLFHSLRPQMTHSALFPCIELLSLTCSSLPEFPILFPGVISDCALWFITPHGCLIAFKRSILPTQHSSSQTLASSTKTTKSQPIHSLEVLSF